MQLRAISSVGYSLHRTGMTHNAFDSIYTACEGVSNHIMLIDSSSWTYASRTCASLYHPDGGQPILIY